MNGPSVDWDHKTVIGKKTRVPRVAKKESDINAARRAGAVVGTQKKSTGGTNNARNTTDHQRIAKIDRENEVAPPPKISLTVAKLMQTARDAKGLSQSDCAKLISEKPSVVQEYESGRAIPNTKVLEKLENVLGVKLRGPNIGKQQEKRRKKS